MSASPRQQTNDWLHWSQGKPQNKLNLTFAVQIPHPTQAKVKIPTAPL